MGLSTKRGLYQGMTVACIRSSCRKPVPTGAVILNEALWGPIHVHREWGRLRGPHRQVLVDGAGSEGPAFQITNSAAGNAGTAPAAPKWPRKSRAAPDGCKPLCQAVDARQIPQVTHSES